MRKIAESLEDRLYGLAGEVESVANLAACLGEGFTENAVLCNPDLIQGAFMALEDILNRISDDLAKLSEIISLQESKARKEEPEPKPQTETA